jgi:preprotein translocase subunit SecE
MFTKLVNYVKGTRAEMKHVKWPVKKQIINLTMLVLGVSLLVAFFLGFFDAIFTILLEKFIL